jgi:hypothetical protein
LPIKSGFTIAMVYRSTRYYLNSYKRITNVGYMSVIHTVNSTAFAAIFINIFYDKKRRVSGRQARGWQQITQRLLHK